MVASRENSVSYPNDVELDEPGVDGSHGVQQSGGPLDIDAEDGVDPAHGRVVTLGVRSGFVNPGEPLDEGLQMRCGDLGLQAHVMIMSQTPRRIGNDALDE